MFYSPLVEKALRFAASAHRAQLRKGTDIPYLTHLAGVAVILARAGFDDDEVLAAAFLHDAVEDAGVTLSHVVEAFTPRVAEMVAALSETKLDAAGVRLPWRDRKREHLARLAAASPEVKAVALADKVHNLGTLADDLAVDPLAWSRFNAGPDELLWYHAAVVDAAGDVAALAPLAGECRRMIDLLRTRMPPA